MLLTINSLKDLDNIAKVFLEKVLNLTSEGLSLEQKNNCVAFYGAMGSGKTTFIKSLCKILGVKDEVTSPTFALINEYRTVFNESIYHFDFYRINKKEEVLDFGYEEYFYSDKLCLIEWPEKIEGLLPQNYIEVKIEVIDQQKRELKVIHHNK